MLTVDNRNALTMADIADSLTNNRQNACQSAKLSPEEAQRFSQIGSMIMYPAHSENPATVSGIARQLSLSEEAANMTVSLLKERGLIAQPSEHQPLTLTTHGKEVFDALTIAARYSPK